MRCQFCHNPDTWKIGTGVERTTDDVLEMVIIFFDDQVDFLGQLHVLAII